ncbi:MAG TPA: MerR family transcriptional regulator [Streptosporangiaceae bacterium]|nr:MerR family transcriptional regulator [Streptosporangiaceae bacterium]
MLTISQLADYVGVTVRAVRHYHERGLLSEPERDASGYRRYDADAVIDLIRIKALADAGVPLARIQQLLAAEPAEFAGAITEIDKALAVRIRELQAQRHRIAQLAAGDRLFVPAEIADLFDRIRGLGVSPQAMRIERDSWIMLAARYPGQARDWAQSKLEALTDPEFAHVYRSYYETFDWDPADPRLAEVADVIVGYAEHHRAELEHHQVDMEQVSAGAAVDDPVAMALVLSRTAAMPAAWERLDELCREKAKARGLAPRSAPSPH